jgi:hypothetical protein
LTWLHFLSKVLKLGREAGIIPVRHGPFLSSPSAGRSYNRQYIRL